MSYISTPHAFDGERWFHAIDPDKQVEGIWHVGRVEPGSTWPVRQAVCGFAQPDIAIGRQETAASIGTRARNVCQACLSDVMRRRLR